MGFRSIAHTHMHNMTAKRFGKTSLPWGPRRSLWAGGSGAFFFIPGLVGLNEHRTSHLLLLALVVQSVFSVMSDYVNSGRDSVWHGIDRYFASLMTVRRVDLPYIAPQSIIIIIIILSRAPPSISRLAPPRLSNPDITIHPVGHNGDRPVMRHDFFFPSFLPPLQYCIIYRLSNYF